GFISTNGRRFYQLPEASTNGGYITLKRSSLNVPEAYTVKSTEQSSASAPDTVVPFMAGKDLPWSIAY
ncbi:hypothetical protein GGI12_006135, partial [Dipsacomyces acuminosporus]